MTSAEEYVHELDGKTGASLKLSILNPKGRIWTMVAGGGASVIYAGMSRRAHKSTLVCVVRRWHSCVHSGAVTVLPETIKPAAEMGTEIVQFSCQLLTFIVATADTVGDLGYAEELGNYAEYSGAPNTQVPLVLRASFYSGSLLFPGHLDKHP